MKVRTRAWLLVLVLFLPVHCSLATAVETTMAFTVSMEDPHTHYYHVVLRCEGLKGETQNFKLPAWTPGYYWIMDYAKNVLNFEAADGTGNPLYWVKTSKNTWTPSPSSPRMNSWRT